MFINIEALVFSTTLECHLKSYNEECERTRILELPLSYNNFKS